MAFPTFCLSFPAAWSAFPLPLQLLVAGQSPGSFLHASLHFVIAQPVESWFEEPLATVRARLRIPDPRAAGVLESGHSVIGDLVYPR